MIDEIYQVLKDKNKIGACKLICNEENGYSWEIDFGGDTHAIYIFENNNGEKIIGEWKSEYVGHVIASALAHFYPDETFGAVQKLGVVTH